VVDPLEVADHHLLRPDDTVKAGMMSTGAFRGPVGRGGRR
jgi:hypothetical protein